MDLPPSDAEAFGKQLGARTKEISERVARDTAAEVAGAIVRKALPSDQDQRALADSHMRAAARILIPEMISADLHLVERHRQDGDEALAVRIDGALAQAEQARLDLLSIIEQASAKLASVDETIISLTATVATIGATARQAQEQAAQALEATKPSPVPKGAIRPSDFYGPYDRSRSYPQGAVIRDIGGSQFIAARAIKAGEAPPRPDAPDADRSPWKLAALNSSTALPNVGELIRSSQVPALIASDTAPSAGPGNASFVNAAAPSTGHIRTWLCTLDLTVYYAVENTAGDWVWAQSTALK